MGFHLVDGKGTGKAVSVSDSNRLQAQSVAFSAEQAAALKGEAFAVTTDGVTLSTLATYNGMLYLENTSTLPMYVTTVEPSCTSIAAFRIIKNPTGGTVISDANAADVHNQNFGSTTPLVATAYAASADGKTLTGGTTVWHTNTSTIDKEVGLIALDPGDSLGVSCLIANAGVTASVNLRVIITDVKTDLGL